MTRVTIGDDSIELSGHAPEKVVCHGISSMTQMTANYLEKCRAASVIRKEGYLKLYDIVQTEYSPYILEAFVDGLRDIDREYPGNIEFIYV